MGVLDTLAAATPLRESVTLIVNASLAAEWDRLKRELEAAAAEDEQSGSLAMPATTRIVNEMEEIRDQVARSEVTFTFEQMDWTARLALQAEHPPRQGSAVDQVRGYNTATYIPALLKATCVSVTDADGDAATDIPAATWTHLLGDPDAKPPVKPALNLGQIDRLCKAAVATNEGESRVPPSARFLLESQDSGASLAQPSPGQDRPRSGSAGGSRPTSPKSSATKKAGSSGS